jgi:hypothetical protein
MSREKVVDVVTIASSEADLLAAMLALLLINGWELET